METEEVMVKKKRTKKAAVPVVAHTLSPTEADVSVSHSSGLLILDLLLAGQPATSLMMHA